MKLSWYPAYLGRSSYLVLQYITLLHMRRCSSFSLSPIVDHQIHFYTIPSLDPYPIKPIRNVVTFAVDDVHLKRQFPSLSAQGLPLPVEPVDFCVVKRNGIAMFTMKDRVVYTKVCLLYVHLATIY